jgi:hypothetical protein
VVLKAQREIENGLSGYVQGRSQVVSSSKRPAAGKATGHRPASHLKSAPTIISTVLRFAKDVQRRRKKQLDFGWKESVYVDVRKR